MITKELKCVVAMCNANGSPDFHPVIVTCTEYQYECGDHYDAARNNANDCGFDVGIGDLVYDENDDGFSHLNFDWSIAQTIPI